MDVDWLSNICLERELGGLGIKNLKVFNLALMGKWVWRMRVEKECLWYKVLGLKMESWMVA